MQQLILRHDIDMSMEAAVGVARPEHQMGIKAHYFVLLRTEFYNLCSPYDWPRLQEIARLGHNIGLHFDASLYPQELDVLEENVARECEILQTILEQPVTAINFHRPAQSLLGLERNLAGRTHAYQPRYFSEIAYCSDSQGAFRYGHPHNHEAFLNRRSMQLVTHPIWWPKTPVGSRFCISGKTALNIDGILA